MSEDKSLDYKKRFSSELTTLPVFRDDQLWNNGDLGIGPDLQVMKAQSFVSVFALAQLVAQEIQFAALTHPCLSILSLSRTPSQTSHKTQLKF